MILAIFALASLLLVSAAISFIAAVNLVPTDFGFTYAQIAAVLFSAGVVAFAIGLAVRVLHQQLHRMAVALENNLNAKQTPVDAPLTPPVIVSHAADHGNSTERSGLSPVAAAGAAGIAAGALVAGAHALAEQPEGAVVAPEVAPEAVTPAISDRILEELESDLFAPAAPVADALTSEIAAPESQPAAEVPTPDSIGHIAVPVDAESPLAAAEEAVASLKTSQFGQDFGLSPDFTLPLTLPPDPVLAEEPRLSSEPDVAAVAEHQPEAPVVEVPPVVPQPGLIADADLAALADDILPPLAPVSTLEVVGAYDSGGTRFTMYSDGSVTAAGPEGETRFRTLDDLRRHLGTHQG